MGSTREPELSAQTKAVFDRNSRTDEQTGEVYMTQDDFIRAVAPEDEDYVSRSEFILSHSCSLAAHKTLLRAWTTG